MRAHLQAKKTTATKKKAKKGAGKAAGGPKRPLSAFLLYCNNKRDKVRAEEGGVGGQRKLGRCRGEDGGFVASVLRRFAAADLAGVSSQRAAR